MDTTKRNVDQQFVDVQFLNDSVGFVTGSYERFKNTDVD